MTAWTDFVKTYAKEHNISYKDAMKEAKESYANTKVETKVKKVETKAPFIEGPYYKKIAHFVNLKNAIRQIINSGMKTTDYYDDRLEKFEYALKRLTSLLTKDSLRDWDMDTDRFIDSLGIFLKEESGIEKTSDGYKLTKPTNLSESIKELDALYESITETTLSKEEEKKIYDDAIFLLMLGHKLDRLYMKPLEKKVQKKMRELLPFYARVYDIIESDVNYLSDEVKDNILKPFGFVSNNVIKNYTDDEWKNYKKGITKSVNDTLKSLEKRYKKQKLTPDLLNFAISPKNEKKVRRRAIFYDGRWV
jgi:hypothetical protein